MPYGRSHFTRSSRYIAGFSLLELMIVLVVMVGVLAIAWPNLQRPLKRAELNQATQQLREAIDDSRYQAISTGTPVFIRLKMGDSEVSAGGFETFASADASVGFEKPSQSAQSFQSSRSAPGSLESENSPPKVWKLPENVVISDVTWSDTQEDLSDDWGTGDSSLVEDRARDGESSKSNERAVSSRLERGEIEQPVEAFDLLQGSEQVWWLPMSSLNQGRDVEITLWDKDSHESMKVSLSSATGELEIHR